MPALVDTADGCGNCATSSCMGEIVVPGLYAPSREMSRQSVYFSVQRSLQNSFYTLRNCFRVGLGIAISGLPGFEQFYVVGFPMGIELALVRHVNAYLARI
jgi:hypothetical protein